MICDYDGKEEPADINSIDGNIIKCQQNTEKPYLGKEYILTDITLTDADKNALSEVLTKDLTIDVEAGTVTGNLPKAGVKITFVYKEKSQFEKTITYKVSNGSWTAGGNEDITEIVVLRDDKGIPSTDGTAILNEIPGVGGKPDKGYKDGSWDSDPEQAQIYINGPNTFTYTYVENKDITKELSYTVNFYKDGQIVDGDTQTITEEVWVNEPGDYEVDIPSDLITGNKYTGYKLSDPIPTKAKNGDVINVYYVKDEAQTKEASFTVRYYKDPENFEEKIISRNIWVGDDEIEVTEADIQKDIFNDEHYIFDSFGTSHIWVLTPENTDPESVSTIPQKVKAGSVIEIYLEKDELVEGPSGSRDGDEIPDKYQTTVTYKVENGNWNDGTKAPVNEVVTFKNNEGICVEKGGTATLNPPAVGNKPDRGFMTGDWDRILQSLEQGGNDNVEFTYRYAQDPNHKKFLYYEIKYYKDGELVSEDTEIVAKAVGVNSDNEIAVDKIEEDTVAGKYPGYKLETDLLQLPTEIISGGSIQLYYVADFSGITVEGINTTYDGKPHTIKISGTLDTDTVSDNADAEYIDASVGFARITVKRDKTEKVYFVPVKINPAPLTITTPSATKVYDGQPLTSAEAENEVAVTGQKGNDVITATASGSITDVGTADNTYVIDWGNTNKNNYIIAKEELGKLEVTKRPVTLTSADLSKEDDGTALTNGDAEVTVGGDGWVDEQGVTYTFTGEQQGVGSTENSFTYEALPRTDLDNYEITPVFGTLTVTAAPEDPVPADPTVPTEPTDPTTPDDPTTPADPAGSDGAGGAGADTPAAGAGTPAAGAGAPAAGAGAPTAGAGASAAGTAAPIAADAGAAPVVAAADDATPLADIDLNDGEPADAEIVAAEDEEVPLDKIGLESDMEKEAAPMCVFHVLILLAALIVFLIYMVAILRLRRRIEDLKNQ